MLMIIYEDYKGTWGGGGKENDYSCYLQGGVGGWGVIGTLEGEHSISYIEWGGGGYIFYKFLNLFVIFCMVLTF